MADNLKDNVPPRYYRYVYIDGCNLNLSYQIRGIEASSSSSRYLTPSSNFRVGGETISSFGFSEPRTKKIALARVSDSLNLTDL